MNKAVFGGSLACITFLLIGTFAYSSNSIMWLASTSWLYTMFRVGMAIVLLAVLFTTPPRRLAMRLLMAVLSVGLLSMGVALSMSDSMHLLDIVLFFELGVAFGIEALEFNENELQDKVIELRKEYALHLAPSVSLQRASLGQLFGLLP